MIEKILFNGTSGSKKLRANSEYIEEDSSSLDAMEPSSRNELHLQILQDIIRSKINGELQKITSNLSRKLLEKEHQLSNVNEEREYLVEEIKIKDNEIGNLSSELKKKDAEIAELKEKFDKLRGILGDTTKNDKCDTNLSNGDHSVNIDPISNEETVDVDDEAEEIVFLENESVNPTVNFKSIITCENENEGESELIEIIDESDTVDIDNASEVEPISTEIITDEEQENELSNAGLIKDALAAEDLLQDSDEELLQESHSVLEELGETLLESSNLLSKKDSSKLASDESTNEAKNQLESTTEPDFNDDFDTNSNSDSNEPIEIAVDHDVHKSFRKIQNSQKIKISDVPIPKRAKPSKASGRSRKEKRTNNIRLLSEVKSFKENERKTVKSSRPRKSCKQCEPCLRDDCSQCKYCLDKPKFGGTFKLKQKCQLRKCANMYTK